MTVRPSSVVSESNTLSKLGLASAQLAHELRNVLMTVAASLHVAQKVPDQATAALARAERATRLGQRLVDGVLALAQHPELRREHLTLAELLQLAQSTLEGEVGGTQFDCEGGELPLHVDSALMARVLHALFANAIAVGAQHIRLRGAPIAGGLVLEIEDDGPGVPPELRETLFEPFATARPGGLGLGLTLAAQIVAAHGGHLRLLTERPRTTFCCELPEAVADE